jgi:hypothetical protein
MSEITCNKCGSHKIIKDAQITDFGRGNQINNLSIQIQKTDRAFFNTSVTGAILAQICGDCGYLELSVSHAAELYAAYVTSKE